MLIMEYQDMNLADFSEFIKKAILELDCLFCPDIV